MRGAEGIRGLCLAGEGVEHDMNVVGLVDDLFITMCTLPSMFYMAEALAADGTWQAEER